MLSPDLKIIVPCKYITVEINDYDRPECISVREKNGCGKLDMEGNVLVPCEYDLVYIRRNEKINGLLIKPGYAYIVSNERGSGLYSIEEQQEIMFGSGKKKSVGNDYVAVMRSESVGLYNYDGEVIIPCRYTRIVEMHNEFYCEICHEGFRLDNGDYEIRHEYDIYSMDGQFLRAQWLSTQEDMKLTERGGTYCSANWW